MRKVKEVVRGEYETRELGVDGLKSSVGSCVAVAVSGDKEYGLMHYDHNTDEEELLEFLDRFSGFDYPVELAGGNEPLDFEPSYENLMDEVKKALDSNGWEEDVHYREIFGHETGSLTVFYDGEDLDLL